MYIIDKRSLKLTIKHSLACEDPLLRAPFSSCPRCPRGSGAPVQVYLTFKTSDVTIQI